MTGQNNEKQEHYLTIKEMVEASGLSEHTLRYYEKLGLIRSVERDNSSKHRRYDEDTVLQVLTLSCLRAMGLSHEEMKKYFDLMEKGRDAAPLQIELFERHRTRLLERIQDIYQQIEYLDGKIDYWQAVEVNEIERAQEIGIRNVELAKKLNKR